MSLSKPMIVDPQSSGSGSGSGSFSFPTTMNIPRGVQIGLMIGIPAAAVIAAGLYWYNSSKSSSIDEGTGETPKSSDLTSTAPEDPVSPKPIHIQLKEKGNDCFKNKEYADALEYYTKAIELKPPDAELAAMYQNRAAVFEKLGDYVQVIREATAALTLNPKYVKALFRRCRAYQNTGFLEEALEDITAVCVFESFKNTSSIQSADTILKEIGSVEAQKILEAKRPSLPSEHSVEAFLRAFYSDPVSQWWREKTSSVQSNGDVQVHGDAAPVKTGFLAALEALKARNYNNIIELCNEELSNPESKYVDETLLLRGTFLYLWGFGDEVREDFKKVISSPSAGNGMKSSAWIKMGTHYAMQQNEEKCNECFDEAEKVDPTNPDVYHQRGQVLLTKGDFEGASLNVNKAYDLRNDFPLTAGSKWYLEFRIATASQDMSGMSEIIRQFQLFTRKFSDSPDIFNLYGQILIELGNFNEADIQFQRVIELDPKNAAVYVHRAMSKYQMTNDIDATLAILYEASKVDPKNEFVYETIGTLELQNGNLDGALVAITKALDLAKTSQEVMMLCSLKKAAEVQKRVKEKYEMDLPSVVRLS